MEGEWQAAARLFTKTRYMLRKDELIEDGPSVALLSYMQYHPDCRSPKTWTGVRTMVRHPSLFGTSRSLSEIMRQQSDLSLSGAEDRPQRTSSGSFQNMRKVFSDGGSF